MPADEFGPIGPAESGGLQPLLRFPQRVWGRSELLLWWTSPDQLPPLVTTSVAGTTPANSGILGLDSTRILLGDQGFDTGMHTGGRFTLGYWADDCQSEGLQASYLNLGRQSAVFQADSATTPIIARPYFEIPNGAQAMLVAHPDFNGPGSPLNGHIRVEEWSELEGVEILWRKNLFQACDRRIDFLLGYRFDRLQEQLQIDQVSGPVVGVTTSLFDLFGTENRFHAAEFGIVYQRQISRLSWECLMKLALGSMASQVVIDGRTMTTTPPAPPSTVLGGLLAQTTNMGVHGSSAFAMAPELGLTIGYDVTCRLRATVGYSFLYWSQVTRPAEQIDLDVTQLPPEAPTGLRRPAVHTVFQDFWAQGLNLGIDYRF